MVVEMVKVYISVVVFWINKRPYPSNGDSKNPIQLRFFSLCDSAFKVWKNHFWFHID